jgi:hypothetical protein
MHFLCNTAVIERYPVLSHSEICLCNQDGHWPSVLCYRAVHLCNQETLCSGIQEYVYICNQDGTLSCIKEQFI